MCCPCPPLVFSTICRRCLPVCVCMRVSFVTPQSMHARVWMLEQSPHSVWHSVFCGIPLHVPGSRGIEGRVVYRLQALLYLEGVLLAGIPSLAGSGMFSDKDIARYAREWGMPGNPDGMLAVRQYAEEVASNTYFATGMLIPFSLAGRKGIMTLVSTPASSRLANENAQEYERMIPISNPHWLQSIARSFTRKALSSLTEFSSRQPLSLTECLFLSSLLSLTTPSFLFPVCLPRLHLLQAAWIESSCPVWSVEAFPTRLGYGAVCRPDGGNGLRFS